jgi:hypothetical protein
VVPRLHIKVFHFPKNFFFIKKEHIHAVKQKNRVKVSFLKNKTKQVQTKTEHEIPYFPFLPVSSTENSEKEDFNNTLA